MKTKTTKKPVDNTGKIQSKIKKIAQVDYRTLIPFQPEDFKKTTKKRIGRLKLSMTEYGFATPFYVWENKKKIFVLDGHHRLMALEQLETEEYDIPKVPAVFLDCKNINEAKEMVLLFNSHYATINQDALSAFITTLDIESLADKFEIPSIKFEGDLDVEEDELPGVGKKPKSKPGDIYELGPHRVVCGDSSDPKTYEAFEGLKTDLLFTDPPYGVSYEGKGKTNKKPIANDNLKPKDLILFLEKVFKNVYETMTDKASFYVCGPSGRDLLSIIEALDRATLVYRHMLIWAKNAMVLGRSDYNYKHEVILFGWTKKHVFPGKGTLKTSVWEVDRLSASKVHPTMKPIALMVNAILNSTKPGQTVTDVFLGSGSTLIACEETKRICNGIETDPGYVDVIVQRWVNFTGQTNIKKNGKPMVWKANK